MRTDFHSTRQVARILGVGIARLSMAVWQGRIQEPDRGPNNNFLWVEDDINRASLVLLGKPYQPANNSVTA